MSLMTAAAWITLCFITCIHIAKHNAQLQRSEQKNLHFGNFKEFLNHMLDISQVLSFVNVNGYADCGFQCLANVACLSFNYAILPNSSSTLHFCQLLATDKYNHSTAFVQSDHFHHYTIASPCESFPCQDGGTCRPLYDKNDMVCDCPDGRNGTHCEKGWFKINTEVVCFGARDDSYGKFSIHKAGKISAFKLAHHSGSVSCYKDDKGTNWGCSHPSYIRQICTHITDASNVCLVNNLNSSAHGCYQLPGFDHNSPEIELNLSSPIGVRAGQEFRIWYAEDLKNLNDDDNAFTKSCVDVYGFY